MSKEKIIKNQLDFINSDISFIKEKISSMERSIDVEKKKIDILNKSTSSYKEDIDKIYNFLGNSISISKSTKNVIVFSLAKKDSFKIRKYINAVNSGIQNSVNLHSKSKKFQSFHFNSSISSDDIEELKLNNNFRFQCRIELGYFSEFTKILVKNEDKNIYVGYTFPKLDLNYTNAYVFKASSFVFENFMKNISKYNLPNIVQDLHKTIKDCNNSIFYKIDDILKIPYTDYMQKILFLS